jgi:phosphoglycerol transferase
MTALGVAGSVGFLALLALALLPIRRAHPREELSRALVVLNLLALLVATTGGFGSMFALLVTPQIRGYTRMQAFVGFFALFAAVLLLERVSRRAGRFTWLAPLLPLVVIVLGLLDQVTPPAVRPYAAYATQYGSDRAFVRRIEAAVPASAMIFELPYQPFPEASAGTSGRQIRYEPLRHYLHSSSLRWSYPAMRSRTPDVFARTVSAQPPAELVQTLSDAGFDGIVIDQRGYGDDGAGIEADLSRELGAEPAIRDDHQVFFDLTAFNQRARAGLTPEERERRRDLAVHPLYLRWTGGFYGAEHGPQGSFRWCSGSGQIEIDNESQLTRPATIAMIVSAPQSPTTLYIRGDLLSETIEIDARGSRLSRTLQISPGRHVLRLHATGPVVEVPGDPRRFAWRTDDATLDELASP